MSDLTNRLNIWLNGGRFPSGTARITVPVPVYDLQEAINTLVKMENLFKRINTMKPSVALDAVEMVVRRIENGEDLP